MKRTILAWLFLYVVILTAITLIIKEGKEYNPCTGIEACWVVE